MPENLLSMEQKTTPRAPVLFMSSLGGHSLKPAVRMPGCSQVKPLLWKDQFEEEERVQSGLAASASSCAGGEEQLFCDAETSSGSYV